MDYLEVICFMGEEDPVREIVMSDLADCGFESFMDEADRLLAYVPRNLYDEVAMHKVLEQYNVRFEKRWVVAQNWNALWEKNYGSVTIDGKCTVRAPFHEKPDHQGYDIIIEPRMSFGTAHHETTSSIISMILEEPLEGKSLLDMGCGTGVLAILSAMRGATPVDAIDNDEWAYNNSVDNVQKNNVPQINVSLGEADLLKGKDYDVIIANINRNILLNDMHAYIDALNNNGVLLMSGFYVEDIPVIRDKAESLGMHYCSFRENHRWVAVKFEKK